MQAIHPDRPILSADYDYEPENDSDPRRRGWLLLGLGAAALALAGFGAVAAYGWLQYGTGVAGDGPAPLVRADLRPVKSRPENPGGLLVPDQDKEIYGTMSPGRTAGAAPTPTKVERLLPPPEAPMPKPVPASPDVAPPVEAVTVPPATPAPASPAPPAVAATPAPPAAPPAVAAAPATPPTSVAPAAGAPAAAAGKAPPLPLRPLPAGAYRIQLAALTSNDDAARAWEKLRRAHPDVLGALTPAIVKVDLPGKGTFYRLQAGPLDRDKAADACARIGRGGCLVVPPT